MTIEEIKKLLSEISPWPWGFSEDHHDVAWDNDGNAICDIDFERRPKDLQFIAAAPKIVAELVEYREWAEAQIEADREFASEMMAKLATATAALEFTAKMAHLTSGELRHHARKTLEELKK